MNEIVRMASPTDRHESGRFTVTSQTRQLVELEPEPAAASCYNTRSGVSP